MSAIVRVPVSGGNASSTSVDGVATLERGAVIFLPDLAFELTPGEQSIFSPATAPAAKNVSFDPSAGGVRGTALRGPARDVLRQALERFSHGARELVGRLLPSYAPNLITARASFRPVEIAGRVTSWRKDDTRLHVDAFPATPVHGRRILRVFANVNPAGRPRVWTVGDRFEAVAGRFAPELRLPWPGSSRIRHLCRLTKTVRSPYDALMLQLHDRMKADAEFQATSPQERVEFPSGTTWLAFTDAVSHAATAGQYQFEQTFLLPIAAMADETRSPLRILEQLKGRPLA
jgi:hypothetical protein